MITYDQSKNYFDCITCYFPDFWISRTVISVCKLLCTFSTISAQTQNKVIYGLL